MYLDIETGTSYEQLKKVVGVLHEPICILGGWAIFFTVNENYKASKGREYLGSKDIDLGFHIPKNASEKEMLESDFNASLKKLEEEGFESISNRLVKHIHRETLQTLSKEEYRKTDSFNIIEMYVDPIVDNIPKDFNKIFKMNPIDESLLTHVFKNPEDHTKLTEVKKKFILPKPSLLLATKLKSLPDRTKDHKRQKDIYDIAALLIFSPKKIEVKELSKFIPKEKAKQPIEQITDKEIEQTETILGLEKNQYKATLINLKNELRK